MAIDDSGASGETIRYEDGIPILDGVRRLNAIERKQAEAEERDEKYKQKQLELNQEQLRVNQRMMYFTLGLVLCAALGAVISIYQARVAKLNADAAIANAQAAKAQVDEMKQSGTDTHDLAEAARKQAMDTDKLANAAIDQVAKLEASVREAHALARASQEAITITRDNFAKDQQPYVWIIPQHPKLEVGKAILWEIGFSNYGRSPAYSMRLCTGLGVAFKGAVSHLRPPSKEECEKPAASEVSETVFPPGYVQSTTVVSSAPEDEAHINFLKSHDGTLVATGIFIYKDVFGHSYESVFCRSLLANGDIANCREYNYMKQVD
jgi:hypothetical protein